MNYEPFIKNLNYLLSSRGLTAAVAAVEMKMSQGTLYRYLNGTRTPDLNIIITLSEYFQVSIDWLLGLDSDKEKQKENELNIEQFTSDTRKLLTLYKMASEDDKSLIHSILVKYAR